MFQRAISVRASTAYIARASSLPTARQLHASPIVSKTPAEKVAEVADKVNKSVGRGLASAIETGEQMTERTKQTVGATKGRAASDAKSAAEKMKGTSHEATEKAAGLASEAKKASESRSGAGRH